MAGWGFSSPIKCGSDTAASVSLLSYGWVAIAMSKAQAQKHRAVSLDTDENTQSPEQDKLWWQFFKGVFAMNKKFIIFTVAVLLAGCASPIESMTPQQISSLSDIRCDMERNADA